MLVKDQLRHCIVVQCLLCIAYCYSVTKALSRHLFIQPCVNCHCYEVLKWCFK